MESPLDPLDSLHTCVALWSAVYGSFAIERHLQLLVKRMEFLPGSGFLSRRDMTKLLKVT